MKSIDLANLGLTDLSVTQLEAVNGGSAFGPVRPIYVPSPTFPEPFGGPFGIPGGPSDPVNRPTITPIW
jgi:hypothetical protein